MDRLRYMWILLIIVSFTLGFAICFAINKTKSGGHDVYMLIDIQVEDNEQYYRYVQQVGGIVRAHGGRYLARGGEVTSLSGNWNPERIVIVAFDNLEQLKKCFASPDYLRIAPLREQSTVSRAIAVEGCGKCP